MINEFSRPISVLLHMLLVVSALLCPRTVAAGGDDIVDRELAARLQELGFTGNIEATLEKRLNRAVNPARANLGRLLWFDTITGLNNDNTCAGCHSPTRGFGDTQSIAIGVQNNKTHLLSMAYKTAPDACAPIQASHTHVKRRSLN